MITYILMGLAGGIVLALFGIWLLLKLSGIDEFFKEASSAALVVFDALTRR